MTSEERTLICRYLVDLAELAQQAAPSEPPDESRETAFLEAEFRYMLEQLHSQPISVPIR